MVSLISSGGLKAHLMSLRRKVGRVFMLGFLGTSLDKDTAQFLTRINPGGVILFSRNFVSVAQLKYLIGQIKELFDQRILIAIDHEGGRIIRFDQGVTVFPGNMALGISGNRKFAFQQGMISALELRELGININLAPVLDVLTDSYNPGITIRSFGSHPFIVASLGVSLIEGMQSSGVSATAKHFPGKGAATMDAHVDLPTIDLPYEAIRTHLYPFIKAIEAGVDLVMSSHVVYSSLDSLPATFSHNIIYHLLRKELGFKGIIISDDLEMGAIGRHYAIEDAVVKCVMAGHNMVLICSNREYQERGFNSLVEAYKSGGLRTSELDESTRRIETLIDKKLYQADKIKPEISGTELAKSIARCSVQISRDKKGLIPIKTDKKVVIIYPDFSSLGDHIFLEREVMEGEGLIRKYLKVPQEKMGFFKVPLEQNMYKANFLINKLEKTDLVIFFCFEAHAYSNQRHLLQAIEKKFREAIVILLGSPLDEKFIGRDVSIIKTYGFRRVQIEAVLNLLFNR